MGGETKRMVYHCQNGPLPLSINPIPQLVLLYNHHHQNTINLSYSTCKLLQFGFSFVNISFLSFSCWVQDKPPDSDRPEILLKSSPFFLDVVFRCGTSKDLCYSQPTFSSLLFTQNLFVDCIFSSNLPVDSGGVVI